MLAAHGAITAPTWSRAGGSSTSRTFRTADGCESQAQCSAAIAGSCGSYPTPVPYAGAVGLKPPIPMSMATEAIVPAPHVSPVARITPTHTLQQVVRTDVVEDHFVVERVDEGIAPVR